MVEDAQTNKKENENRENEEVTPLAIKLRPLGYQHDFPVFEVTMVRAAA